MLPITFGPGECPPAEVWVVSGASQPGQDADPCLSSEERARAGRYLRPADRARFVRCRSALRRVLADRLGCLPHEIELATEPHGRPVLRRAVAPLWFNVSHSADLGLVAVADVPVGVDVERIDSRHVSDGAAATFLTARELAAWRGLPPDDRVESFFACWTGKEAFAKASGLGFVGAAPEQVDLCFPDPPGIGRFAPAAGYLAAIAVAERPC
jgi:4'-phosphopantetheinyl transferase